MLKRIQIDKSSNQYKNFQNSLKIGSVYYYFQKKIIPEFKIKKIKSIDEDIILFEDNTIYTIENFFVLNEVNSIIHEDLYNLYKDNDWL